MLLEGVFFLGFAAGFVALGAEIHEGFGFGNTNRREFSVTKHLVFRCALAVLVSLGVLQCVSIIYARRATIRGVKLERALEGLSVGNSTKVEIENRFNNAEMTLKELACSPAPCSTLYLTNSNYPRFEISQYIALDRLLAGISVIRPTVISVGLYLKNDRLSQVDLFFGADEAGDGVQFTRWHLEGTKSGEVISVWRKNPFTGTRYLAVSIDEDGGITYGSLARTFNLGCLSRIISCNATQLWPTAPPPKKGSLDESM